jgi:hypothetical protein
MSLWHGDIANENRKDTNEGSGYTGVCREIEEKISIAQVLTRRCVRVTVQLRGQGDGHILDHARIDPRSFIVRSRPLYHQCLWLQCARPLHALPSLIREAPQHHLHPRPKISYDEVRYMRDDRRKYSNWHIMGSVASLRVNDRARSITRNIEWMAESTYWSPTSQFIFGTVSLNRPSIQQFQENPRADVWQRTVTFQPLC